MFGQASKREFRKHQETHTPIYTLIFNVQSRLGFIFTDAIFTKLIISIDFHKMKKIILNPLPFQLRVHGVDGTDRFLYQQNKIMSSDSPQKASRSLPPLPQHRSYIQRTLELLDGGCYKGSTLNIDGDIGDYRMRIFRSKDKKDYAKNIHSVFTNSFTDSLLPKESHNKEVRELISGIIRQPRNSITPQPETIEAVAVQGQEEKLGKGDISGVMEEEGHLLYNYLPEYQRQRWFEVKDKSRLVPLIAEKSESLMSNKKSISVSKKSNKIRHIFAYLENPLYLKAIK